MAVQALGNNRAKRARQGRYYVGKRMGIPPNRRSNATGTAKSIASLAKVVTTTVVPQAAQAVRNMQVSATTRKMATENIATLKLTTTGVVQGDFGICYSESANPADPGFTASLAAIANQYQQFRCNALKFTFKPSATTSTPGQFYIGFTPVVTANDPQSASDITGMYATEQGGLFGAATVLTVPVQALQHAYNIQQIDKSKTQEDTTQVSPGRVICGWSGAGAFVNGTVIGNLSVTYCYDFMTTKVTHGSNAVNGAYAFTGNMTALTFDRNDLGFGYHTLKPTGTAGVYAPRVQGCRHAIVYRGTIAAGVHTTVFSYSHDGVNWTVQAPQHTLGNLVDYMAAYTMPPASFYKLEMDAAHNLTACTIRVASLPSPPVGE